MTSWSNDEVMEFLELYKSEEILWNPNHSYHKNRREVDQAWERIKHNLGIDCSISDLKKKKESLMSSYRLNKKKNSSTFSPTWFAYSIMDSFLGGKYEYDSNEWMETTEFIDTGSLGDLSTDDQTFDTKPLLEAHNKNYCNTNRRRLSSTRNNRKRCYRNVQLEKEENQLSKYFQEEVDECDLYCQLLAKKLRKLDENQRDISMHEIDNIMFRAKIEQINNINDSDSQLTSKSKRPVIVLTAETRNVL